MGSRFVQLTDDGAFVYNSDFSSGPNAKCCERSGLCGKRFPWAR